VQDVTRRPGGAFLRGICRQQGVVLVLLAYGLLAVVMTWPLAARLGTHLPGVGDDLWAHQWSFWGVEQSYCTSPTVLRVRCGSLPVKEESQ